MIVLLLALGLNSFAGNSVILSCKIHNPQWGANIELDAIGAGSLVLKKAKGEKPFACPLKLKFFKDGSDSVVPEITAVFLKKNCDSILSLKLKAEILDQISLSVMTKDKKPTAQVQWLKSQQPEACEIEKFSREDLRRNAEKWLNGTWGKVRPTF